MSDELVILKEIGRVAAYYGSKALSDFLGSKIVLSQSLADTISLQRVPQNIKIDKIGVAIFSRLQQGLRGEVVFILDERNAFKLVDLSPIKKGDSKELGVLTEMGVSIIKEIGNIVIGSYLTALSLTLKRMIVPPLPTFLSGSLDHIFLDFIFSPYKNDPSDVRYFIQTLFEAPKEQISGYLCLILSLESIADIKTTFKGTLEEEDQGSLEPK